MNESFLIIETDQEYKLTDILVEFANLYVDSQFTKSLQLYRKKGSPTYFLLKFEIAPDHNHFGYLVNYLNYPIDHDDFKSRVKGFFRNEEDLPINITSSKWLMFYNAEHDSIPPDAVSLVTMNNHNYLLDFGGSINPQRIVKEIFKQPDIDLEAFYHIIDIIPSISTKKSSNSNVKLTTSELISAILTVVVCFIFAGVMIAFGETDIALYWFVVGFFGIGCLFMLWKVLFPTKYEAMKYTNRKKRK